jgi:hypothetical protein
VTNETSTLYLPWHAQILISARSSVFCKWKPADFGISVGGTWLCLELISHYAVYPACIVVIWFSGGAAPSNSRQALVPHDHIEPGIIYGRCHVLLFKFNCVIDGRVIGPGAHPSPSLTRHSSVRADTGRCWCDWRSVKRRPPMSARLAIAREILCYDISMAN